MYLHHLLVSKEMTAQVLLTIHNCHQLNTLVSQLNSSSDKRMYISAFLQENTTIPLQM